MNTFWERAKKNNALEVIFDILKRELDAETSRKSAEIAKFAAVKDNPTGKIKLKQDSGLTVDICCRILGEVISDANKITGHQLTTKNSVYGENKLGLLFNDPSKKWCAGGSGCYPVDAIIVYPTDATALLGDCKFGLKSEKAWIVRNSNQYNKEFGRKFDSVGSFLLNYDNVNRKREMLLIVTSAMAPLLINRFDDFKLDPNCAGIPSDKIVVCSVEDIESKIEQYL